MNTTVNEITEAKEVTEVIEPKYTFRELNSTDLFPMIRIVRKIGVDKFKSMFNDEEMKALIKGKQDEMSNEGSIALMLDVAQVVIDGVGDCENEIFSLFARVSNMDEKEIKALDLATFTTMIIDFFKKDELKDFLRAVFTALGVLMN